MLLPFPARVFSTLLALTLGARPAQLDGITLDSSSVHQLDSLHDSLRVPRAVSLLTVTPPNAATSTRLPQRPASDPSRLQRSATVADVADDGTACSITNGTGMNANQCRCGERWCRSRQWCISATSECLEAGTALRHAIDEHGSEAIPLIHQALDDSMVVDRREAKTAESAEDGAKCCKCKDDATTWSKSGTCTECWPSDVAKTAPVPSDCNPSDAGFKISLCIRKCRAAFVEAQHMEKLRKHVVETVLPYAIGKLGNLSIPLLDRAMNDTAWQVREKVAEVVLPKAIGELGDDVDMLPLVSKAITDQSSSVRQAAAREALPEAVDKYCSRAKRLIDKAADDWDGKVRMVVGQNVTTTAIRKCGIDMIPTIRRGIICEFDLADCHAFADQLTGAVEVFGNASLPLLEVALKSPDAGVRARAAGQPLLLVLNNQTLSESFGAVEWAERMFNDTAPEVKTAAGAAFSVVAMAAKARAEAAETNASVALNRQFDAENAKKVAQEALSNATKRMEIAERANREAHQAQERAERDRKMAEQRQEVALEDLARAEAKNFVFKNMTEALQKSQEELAKLKEQALKDTIALQVREGVEKKTEWFKEKLAECSIALGAAALPLVATVAYWAFRSSSAAKASEAGGASEPQESRG